MPGPQIGVALLGAGIFAKEAHLPALIKIPDFKLLAVYSRSLKSAESFASDPSIPSEISATLSVYSDESPSTSNLDSLLLRPDISAVIIALPIPVQPSIIKKCLTAGKHVLAEKPAGPTIAIAKSLIDDWEKNFYDPKGLIWIVAEQFGFETGLREAAEVVQSGKIGDIRWFGLDGFGYVKKGSKYYETPWRTVPDYQGGFILDGGVHSAALLRILFPTDPVKSISCLTAQIQPHLPPVDTFISSVQLASGLIGTFNLCSATEFSPPKDRWLTVLGSKGRLEVHNEGDWVVKVTVEKSERADKFESDGIFHEIKAFYEAIKGGKGSEAEKEALSRGGPREALKDLIFIEGGLKSGEKGGERVLVDKL